ncbi:MAG: sulfotransferase family protein [Melioribacteraceae bacterium]|nr:sulfotransferase family protein [Melioribacteraceae bacterium]MCF8263077.1 sulfotransferase family protein [Melioribacteraceae bacterium]MCF8431225.1 sulfotransferase family protein [Melioribacteraceae bacterium]
MDISRFRIESTREKLWFIRNKPKETFWFLRNRPKRILFDHLPKCAGSEINNYVKTHLFPHMVFHTSQVTEKNHELFKSFPQKKRYRFRFVTGHFADELIEYIHPKTLTATVFREPVDRLISHYYYVKRTEIHYLYKKVTENNLSLLEYISSDLSDELRNWYTTHFTGLSIEEAEKNPEKSVELAFQKIVSRYDLVGFQDDLIAFIENLRKMARLRNPYATTNENKTEKRPKLDDISEAVRLKIADINFLDISLYQKLKEHFKSS